MHCTIKLLRCNLLLFPRNYLLKNNWQLLKNTMKTFTFPTTNLKNCLQQNSGRMISWTKILLLIILSSLANKGLVCFNLVHNGKMELCDRVTTPTISPFFITPRNTIVFIILLLNTHECQNVVVDISFLWFLFSRSTLISYLTLPL